MEKGRAILIAGPTASGKSGLALALAERLGGTIINADSMQVYEELRVLTARPTAGYEARIPHALYGFVPGREAYSAGRYAADAARAIAAARKAGRRPILVGGTGLYFKTLLDGLSPVPPVAEEIRTHWRSEAERIGPAKLHAILSNRDPGMAARLRPSDPQRLARALEVLDATGQSLADWQARPGEPVLAEAETIRLIVTPGREELHRRCEARFDKMMTEGALDEVRALAALKLDPQLPVMRALGVRPLMQLLSGKMSRHDAIARTKAETRHYAKRQATWFRSNMRTWMKVSTQEMERDMRSTIAFIDP